MKNNIARVKKIKGKSTKKWKFCILIILDIKNAFNTAKWEGIKEDLKKKGISPYLTNIIASYLSNIKAYATPMMVIHSQLRNWRNSSTTARKRDQTRLKDQIIC